MIRLLLLFLLPLALNASKILSYNIYNRTDRVDVMITFDTPYEGKIKQSTTKSKIIIKLEDAEIESAKLKRVSSKFLQSLTITPLANYIQIVAVVPSSTKLRASKTSDAYGLRLRFTNVVAKKQTNSTSNNQATNLSSLPTQKDIGLNSNYYIVVGLLIIGIIVMLVLKRKITSSNTNKKTKSWLFKHEAQSNTPATNSTTNNQIPQNNVSIRFQKAINGENSVVMLDFINQSYLVLMGNSNILLDKFTDNKPASQEEFESILQTRHKELDEFLKVQSKEKEPLQIYKEKAASISYENA